MTTLEIELIAEIERLQEMVLNYQSREKELLQQLENITNENKNLMQILTQEKEKFQGELESLISELSQYRNLSEQLKSEYQQNLESFTENLNIELRKL